MPGAHYCQDSQAQLLRRQLARRFGELPAWASEKIDTAAELTLESWMDAVFDASCSLSIEPAEDAENWTHSGGDSIAAFVESAVDALRTVHHGHCHEIELLSETEARGVIAMEDQIWDAEGKPFLHGMGHYHETYRREADGWKIVTSRISRLHVIVGE